MAFEILEKMTAVRNLPNGEYKIMVFMQHTIYRSVSISTEDVQVAYQTEKPLYTWVKLETLPNDDQLLIIEALYKHLR